ncbi:MAG: Gfo/Idh/MocA family oxidoreductase, partial [Verrucomicrobiae bacterium]|nr:Gfo/Idh/MocA family oxidoreductase [Verrucomicrobiae bacterium]
MKKRNQPLRVGVIGCGAIAPAYFQGCRVFSNIQIVACADLDEAKAKARAAEFGVRACSVEELLNADDVDIVLNLTVPKAHAEVSLAALRAGKHVYSEKPLAVNLREARRILATAAAKNLRVGCAPDTLFGVGVQTARRFIDDGELGDVVAVVACMMSHGPESWHPNPAFYYQEGG